MNSAAGTTESFCYDKLNRLTDYAPTSSCTGTGTVNVAYDDTGNITKKSDVCSTANCYAYPSSGAARPHAIASLTGTFNGASNPSFSYDNNGNMTAGAGRTVVYTAFNIASEMTEGTTKLCWTYDSEHSRVRMDEVSTCGGSPTSSTYYLNDPISGIASEKVVSGSTTTTKDYLFASGVMVGLRTKVGAGTPAVSYFVLDHLGSIAVTTDETGVLVCRLAYDPWGKTTASGTGCTPPTRGFTGEEQIATGALVNLVNLNARVYDPVLGRLMAADPILANPYSEQALNGFSYVENSPLAATDPTGMLTLCAHYSNGVTSCNDLPPLTAPLFDDVAAGDWNFGRSGNDLVHDLNYGFFNDPPPLEQGAGGLVQGPSGQVLFTASNVVPTAKVHFLGGTLLIAAVNGSADGSNSAGGVYAQGRDSSGVLLGAGAVGAGVAATVATMACIVAEPCGLAEAAGIGTTVLTSGLIGTGAAMLNPGPKTSEAMFTAGAVSGIVSAAGSSAVVFELSAGRNALAQTLINGVGSAVGEGSAEFVMGQPLSKKSIGIAGLAAAGGYVLSPSYVLDSVVVSNVPAMVNAVSGAHSAAMSLMLNQLGNAAIK